jgi:ubiquinone/menaquinone biosynthesis C-methylase UbiE
LAKKKMIITRTVPMATFLNIMGHVEQRFPEIEKTLLLQSGVIGQQKKLDAYPYIVVPNGTLVFNDLPGDVKDRLRAAQADIFIIASKILHSPDYDELIKLARFSGAQDIYMISQYLGQRLIRHDGRDVLLDEAEIARLSAEDVKTRFSDSPYYDNVESAIDHQWPNIIYPLIKDCDFSRVLELAPGHGRNTRKLMTVAQEIVLVDANKTCIDYCKQRFKDADGSCRLSYYVNDGASLEQTADDTISFIYSWDSMVHFDSYLMRRYLAEFQRVLKPGGYGFVHHSNYGNLIDNANYSVHVNPHGRSNMTKERFAQYCGHLGLEVSQQKIIDWGVKNLDCLSVFKKL